MEHRINQELIRAMRAQLHDDPAHWVQQHWVTEMEPATPTATECDTAYCAAGWALALTGWHIREGAEWIPLSHIRKVTGLENAQILSGLKIREPRTILIDPEIHVSDAAEVILGLENIRIPDPRPSRGAIIPIPDRPVVNPPAAHLMFAGGNTLADIDAVIAAVFATAGIES
jgi:hypothetical protein